MVEEKVIGSPSIDFDAAKNGNEVELCVAVQRPAGQACSKSVAELGGVTVFPFENEPGAQTLQMLDPAIA